MSILYYPGSEQQRRRTDSAHAQTDLLLFCSHMAETGFLMTWLKYDELGIRGMGSNDIYLKKNRGTNTLISGRT